MRPHILFVTGKLAEPALRRTLADLAPRVGFDYSIHVLPITVAALATAPWIARRLSIPEHVDRVILPGLCRGDVDSLAQLSDAPIELGPKDLFDLPDFFGAKRERPSDYGDYDIHILAEINHAPNLPLDDLLTQARCLRANGADIIDLGCNPGERWSHLADAVRALHAGDLRVSIDTFDLWEAETAAQAGAQLVLSVNHTNRHAAASWGCEVVAVPDHPHDMQGLHETVDHLERHQIPYRIDPILEPIGFCFAKSLGRYLEARRRFPHAEIMMGIGNLTELTDVDSAGVNVTLLGFCQELGIRSVLTTQVINWARSSVRELDFARRLVHYACKNHVLPKHLETNLLMLRDPKLRQQGRQTLNEIADQLTDRNFRLFAEDGLLHLMNAQLHIQGDNPFELFEAIQKQSPVDPSHAFYLGYEMAKAVTALTLGKNYAQDQALRWGFLTRPEKTPKDRANLD